jgi:anti-sigma factor RsiW
MSTTTHPIAPEEVMAFLDGELSDVKAAVLSSHLEQCAECHAIADKLRGSSHSLTQWSVPAAPKTLEESVKGLADKKISGEKIGEAGFFVRASFWTWKQWTAGLAATAGVLLLVLGLTNAGSNHAARFVGQAGASRAGKESSVSGTVGKLQVDGQPTDRVARVFSNQIPPQATTGPAPDSNGLMQSSTGFALSGSQTSPSDSPVDGRDGSLLPLQQPMIARTVSLSIVTKDFAASRASLDAILTRRHGYAAELSANTAENAPRSLQAALRIPAAELSSAVADLKSLGRVENESQSGEEVTQQHADLVARLKNSRETEQRLQAILTQRTGKIKDVLEVEREIARVRGEIEAMEAEQKNLEHRVEFASVNLQLTEEYKASLNAPAASMSTRIHNAMVAGFKSLAETILGILLFFLEAGPTLLVAALIFLAPAWLLWRRYRRAAASVSA